MSTIKNQYWNFWFFQQVFFQKHKSSAQSLNFDWMWLVNELVLTFSAPIKCTKAQFNMIILSRVMPHTTYRQTDTFVKTLFSDSGGLKTKDLMKFSKVIFHIKPIPSHPWWKCKHYCCLRFKWMTFTEKDAQWQ